MVSDRFGSVGSPDCFCGVPIFPCRNNGDFLWQSVFREISAAGRHPVEACGGHQPVSDHSAVHSFYIGLAHTAGTKASIIVGANVFIAILTASLIFRQEKLTGEKILGCLVGFAGVVLINMTPGGISMHVSFMGEGSYFYPRWPMPFHR